MLNLIHPNHVRAKASIDGKQQKKRGPKTDSKPALNSKQEKNRQAQRYAFPLIVVYFSANKFFFAILPSLFSDIQSAGIERATTILRNQLLGLTLIVRTGTTARELQHIP